MNVLFLALKDLRLLVRDRRALVILLAMPVIFILVLGVSLGEGFGQKPDDRLRVTLVVLDQGDQPARVREGMALLSAPLGGPALLGGLATAHWNHREPWSEVVLRDLTSISEDQQSSVRVEVLATREEGLELVRSGKRAAVLVLGPLFSERVTVCSFLADGINPFYRDGISLNKLDAELLADPTQSATVSIIDQAVQVSLFRVVLPWMIGRAFEKLSDPSFIDLLGKEVKLPSPLPLDKRKIPLSDFLILPEHKKAVGTGVQASLSKLFPNYELTGKTWGALTRSGSRMGEAGTAQYQDEGGSGVLRRGAVRYQVLVPSYTVMFAFFLVLTVGWLFVAERRQGTLKRLLIAPLSRSQILLGKMVPCYALSLAQGLLMLAAGKLVFGMSWGPEPGWLVPVVVTTSMAAMGMALLVACLARTETQVAVYGTLLVLVLAGISGCLMPRALMPENMKELSRVTPHAWALDAYNQLLLSPSPNLAVVATSCAVLAAFGVGFVVLAWAALRLE